VPCHRRAEHPRPKRLTGPSGLDAVMRQAFRHDRSDHLSEFYVRTGAGRRGGTQGLGSITPFGAIEGEDLELADLDLEPGDELTYVYDFGDWIEHTMRVEAVVTPEPGATYPREVRKTAAGLQRGKKGAL
jgi:hypothetical protein